MKIIKDLFWSSSATTNHRTKNVQLNYFSDCVVSSESPYDGFEMHQVDHQQRCNTTQPPYKINQTKVGAVNSSYY